VLKTKWAYKKFCSFLIIFSEKFFLKIVKNFSAKAVFINKEEILTIKLSEPEVITFHPGTNVWWREKEKTK
jgi:hypothetical protein